MPYVSKALKGETAREWLAVMGEFTPIKPNERERCEALVVISSTILDPGVDWNEYVLLDASGKEYVRRRVDGF